MSPGVGFTAAFSRERANRAHHASTRCGDRWEPLELVRKLALTGFVLLIPASQSFLRLVLALMLTLISLTLYLQLKPFKADDNDLIAVGGQMGLVCVFLGAGYLKLYDEISKTELRVEGARELLGFQDSTSLVTIMMVFTIAMVILSLLTVIYKLGTMDRWVTVKLKKTGKEPELQTYKKMKYHAFLSHVSPCTNAYLPCRFANICTWCTQTWRTGQDQVAVIKKQLIRLLPGVKCFLGGLPRNMREGGGKG